MEATVGHPGLGIPIVRRRPKVDGQHRLAVHRTTTVLRAVAGIGTATIQPDLGLTDDRRVSPLNEDLDHSLGHFGLKPIAHDCLQVTCDHRSKWLGHAATFVPPFNLGTGGESLLPVLVVLPHLLGWLPVADVPGRHPFDDHLAGALHLALTPGLVVLPDLEDGAVFVDCREDVSLDIPVHHEHSTRLVLQSEEADLSAPLTDRVDILVDELVHELTERLELVAHNYLLLDRVR